MSAKEFEIVSDLPVSAGEAYAWHARPGAFQRLVPPWQRVEVENGAGGLGEGSRLNLRLYKGPLGLRWVAEHRDVRPGRSFEDVQAEGPFAFWEHRHEFLPEGDERSRLRDRIRYRLPGGPLAAALAGGLVERDLARAFAYRHRVTAADLALHRRFRERSPLTVAVSGAGGLVGSALTSLLTTGGHRVVRLVRRPARPEAGEVEWSPRVGVVEPRRLDGVDAVVHLAGESIASGRWTSRRKAEIRDSRVDGTRRLVASLGEMERPPGVFLCASAIGFYGDRGDAALDERSAAGGDFLAEVCEAWEREAAAAEEAWGARVAALRFGVVLSPAGGALAKMLPPFRLGAGGRLGDGRQVMSWITLDDAAGAILHTLMTPDLRGPVNLTAPEPVSNGRFTRVLGRALSRPTPAPMPAFAARLLFGEMADELLLASTRALPGKLRATGYEFRHGRLEAALPHLLGGREAPPRREAA